MQYGQSSRRKRSEQPTYSSKTIREAGLSAETTYSLAESKARDEKWLDALNLYQETLRLQREEFGLNDPQVARTLNDIAVTMCHIGGAEFYIKALRTFREALLIQRKVLPEKDKETAITAKNMSILMNEMKDLQSPTFFRKSSEDII